MPTPLNLFLCNLPSFHKQYSNEKPFRASLNVVGSAKLACVARRFIIEHKHTKRLTAPHGFGASHGGFPAFPAPSNCLKTARLRRLVPGRLHLIPEHGSLGKHWGLESFFLSLIFSHKVFLPCSPRSSLHV